MASFQKRCSSGKEPRPINKGEEDKIIYKKSLIRDRMLERSSVMEFFAASMIRTFVFVCT